MIAPIELDGAPCIRLPSRLIDAVGWVNIGARVTCTFLPLAGGAWHVPVFHLANR